MDATRFVVSLPPREQGIGSNLASLAGALRVAKDLGRPLLVDWRESVFLKDKALNYFTEVFEAPGRVLGVRVEYAGRPPAPEWRDDPAQALEVYLKHAPGQIPADPPRFLVLTGFHDLSRVEPAGDPAEHVRFLRSFYESISPLPELRAAIEEWYDAHLRGRFVVGLNVSSGNGSFHRRGHVDAGVFENERLFLGKLERARRRALRGLPRQLRESARVFVATDSAAMQELLLRLPGAVARRTLFPPEGRGRHFCDYDELGATDLAGVADTVADMFLLARCDALIRNPSQFSTYALTMTSHGRVQEIESFYAYRRWLRTLLAGAGGSLGKRALRRLLGGARGPAEVRQ